MTPIKHVQKLGRIDAEATYLVLISPEEIPHIIIVHAGMYFSLTHKKVILAAPFHPYLTFLKRTNRKLLLFKLNGYVMPPQKAFEVYEKASQDGATCLNPVRDCLLPNSKAGFVYELIPDLYAAQKITDVFQVNMDLDFLNSTEFTLKTYTKEAIYSYIQTLNLKYAKRP